ncbi:hypothetical protein ACFVTF_33770 [Kitasatospora sp. NPDC057940]|uniref:hypothetical protein n=1 Tax=Kitasatospora sp. NPDC057940 TaxID=3346285 RepID=UPI0036DE3327
MAEPLLDIDVAGVLRAVSQADALSERALAGEELTGPQLDLLYALYEELTAHLALLLAATEEKYRHSAPRTPMRVLVRDALRLGGNLVARPLRLGVLDIVAMAPICRLLLVLHQGKNVFDRYAGGHPLVWAEPETVDGQAGVSAPAGEP